MAYRKPLRIKPGQHLRSTQEVVSALGWIDGAMHMTGYRATAIYNWLDRGVPASWHRRVEKSLERAGYTVDDAVFERRKDKVDG